MNWWAKIVERLVSYRWKFDRQLSRFESEFFFRICRFREENLSFNIPKEFLRQTNESIDGLFHGRIAFSSSFFFRINSSLGGIDTPSVNAFDPIRHQRVHITKYLSLKSKSNRSDYLVHLVEHIDLTSRLSHENVRRVLFWYIADKGLYSITTHIQFNLRQAIQTQRFPIERIRLLASQIIKGTIYLHCQGLSPLTPWYIFLLIDRSIDRGWISIV